MITVIGTFQPIIANKTYAIIIYTCRQLCSLFLSTENYKYCPSSHVRRQARSMLRHCFIMPKCPAGKYRDSKGKAPEIQISRNIYPRKLCTVSFKFVFQFVDIQTHTQHLMETYDLFQFVSTACFVKERA